MEAKIMKLELTGSQKANQWKVENTYVLKKRIGMICPVIPRLTVNFIFAPTFKKYITKNMWALCYSYTAERGERPCVRGLRKVSSVNGVLCYLFNFFYVYTIMSLLL